MKTQVSQWDHIVTSRLVGVGVLGIYVYVMWNFFQAFEQRDASDIALWFVVTMGLSGVMSVVLGAHSRQSTRFGNWLAPNKSTEKDQWHEETREKTGGGGVGYKDLIEEQLRERSVEIGSLSWRQQMGRKRSTAIWGSVLFYPGILLLGLGGWSFFQLWFFVDEGEIPDWSSASTLTEWQEDRVWFEFIYAGLLALGLILFTIGGSLRSMSQKALGEQEMERASDLALRQQFATMTMEQRVAVLANLSSIEIARLQNIGVVTREEARLAEIREERQWKSDENEKDRQLTIDQLITKMTADVQVIEARMGLENPNADKRSQEEMIILKGRIAQLREINKIKDPTLRKQMFDEFKRGWK